MKTRILAFIILISLLPFMLPAANGAATVTLKGRVVDENNQPVEYANAALVNTQTKSIVNGDVCNKQGEFIISKIEKGDYILIVSLLDYQQYETKRVTVNGNSKTIQTKIVLQDQVEQVAEVDHSVALSELPQ